MDANAVSPLWFSKVGAGSRESELRGRILEEWIITNSMDVLNEPSESYTFSGSGGESDIDVTLVNEACAGCDFEWVIKPDWGISDHNVLWIQMRYRGDEKLDMCRWVWKCADWEGYVNDLRECASVDAVNMIDEMNAERLVENVTSWIQEVNDRGLRRHKPKMVMKLVWWSDELDRMKKNVRKLRRAFQRARKRNSQECERLCAYKQAVWVYKKEIWKAKEENWKQFVSESANRDPWSNVYRVCMGKYRRDKLSAIKVGDRTTCSWRESVDLLMERFFPAPRMRTVRDASNVCVNERWFDWDEVKEAVISMKLKKVPGLGICTEMLRAIWRAIPEWLKRMYDICLSTMCFPAVWKTARLIVLLKSPDKIRSDHGSYRPICLLSVLGKVLECLMVKRLEHKLGDTLCNAQYGFKANRSIEGAWSQVIKWVSGSDSKYVLGIFVDFKGAFDNLEWKCVLDKLREVECNEMGLWES